MNLHFICITEIYSTGAIKWNNFSRVHTWPSPQTTLRSLSSIFILQELMLTELISTFVTKRASKQHHSDEAKEMENIVNMCSNAAPCWLKDTALQSTWRESMGGREGYVTWHIFPPVETFHSRFRQTEEKRTVWTSAFLCLLDIVFSPQNIICYWRMSWMCNVDRNQCYSSSYWNSLWYASAVWIYFVFYELTEQGQNTLRCPSGCGNNKKANIWYRHCKWQIWKSETVL